MSDMSNPEDWAKRGQQLLECRQRIAELEEEKARTWGAIGAGSERYKARIKELEAEIAEQARLLDMSATREAGLLAELKQLREAGATIISAIRFGLSQDELEAMEEFELLLGGGEK